MDSKAEKYRNVHQHLIDGCMNGDQKAQFQVYKLYYRSMYNTSLRIVNDEMEAEDIMQESFLSAFEKIGTYRGEVSFGAWLRRIVLNRALDHLRRKKVIFEPVEEVAGLTEEQSPWESVKMENTEEQLEKVRTAINKLPDGYRVILSLYLLEGYDHEEISEILGISGSTSRSQYARARKKLLELIKN